MVFYLGHDTLYWAPVLWSSSLTQVFNCASKSTWERNTRIHFPSLRHIVDQSQRTDSQHSFLVPCNDYLRLLAGLWQFYSLVSNPTHPSIFDISRKELVSHKSLIVVDLFPALYGHKCFLLSLSWLFMVHVCYPGYLFWSTVAWSLGEDKSTHIVFQAPTFVLKMPAK